MQRILIAITTSALRASAASAAFHVEVDAGGDRDLAVAPERARDAIQGVSEEAPVWRTLLQLFAFSLLTSGLPAHALNITSHARFVEAQIHDGAGVTLAFERHDAPDLGPFQASARADQNGSCGPGSFAVAEADQDSSIGVNEVTASGNTLGSVMPCHVAEARSELNLLFELASPTSWSIAGSVLADPDGIARVRLQEEGGALIFSSPDIPGNDPGPFSFSDSGVLQPGLYRLRAQAFVCTDEMGFCGDGFADAAYTFSFTVPEPGSAALLGLALAGLAAGRRRS